MIDPSNRSSVNENIGQKINENKSPNDHWLNGHNDVNDENVPKYNDEILEK